MQAASSTYKSAIKQPFRNRGYVKATIGVFNQEAQEDVYVTEVSDSPNMIRYPYHTTSATKNGVTYKVNTSDRSVTFNGTASSNTYFHFSFYTSSKSVGFIEEGKRYAYYIDVLDGSIADTNPYLRIYNDAIGFSYGKSGTVNVFTSKHTGECSISFRCNSGGTFTNYKIRPMMVEVNSDGSYQKEYEQYSIGEWYSDTIDVFNNYKVTKQYATKEKNFCKLDGTMYFAPKPNTKQKLYNVGLVNKAYLGGFTFKFNSAHDIKGFTIDFGHCYPTEFTIVTNNVSNTYTNNKSVFTTEDIFNGTTSIKITPVTMVNDGRLRILEFQCGIVNTFSNEQVIDYSWKEYVSSISDSIPSQDMSITVDNTDMYYSPNNPDSALAYMELGQEISVQFGYDIDGEGTIEWINPVKAFLKTWEADEQKAKFTATDIFDHSLNGTYNKDVYHDSGISLYDLAASVFSDAGITSYKIDNYLKEITVYNPLPVCSHAESLQIIANAGRCALQITRDGKICLLSSFVPTTTVAANSLSEYGKLDGIMSSSDKKDYAMISKGYNKLDGSLYFWGGSNTLNTGYVSDVYYTTKSWNLAGLTPSITVVFESKWTFYGLGISFKNVFPPTIKIASYSGATLKETKTYTVDSVDWQTDDEFSDVDKLIITAEKGSEYSRLFIDSIHISDITSYTVNRDNDIIGTSTSVRNEKTKSISVSKYNYKQTTELKELAKSEMTMDAKSNYYITVDMSNPSYGYSVVTDDSSVTPTITESSAHYCVIKLRNSSSSAKTFNYTLSGYEYSVDTTQYKVTHNNSGEEVTWNNPLISNDAQATKLEEWLSDYYLGTVSYTIPWRGDPRVDANDIFYVETTNRGNDLIRVYQNELKFNGAWSGTMKGRVADLTWQ